MLLSSGTPARYTSIPATFTSIWFYFCFFSMTFTSTAFAFMDYYFYLLICYFFEAPTWIAPLSGGTVFATIEHTRATTKLAASFP